jgi:hypothetical protein
MRKFMMLLAGAAVLVAGALAQPPAGMRRPALTAEQAQELEQSLAKDPSSLGLRMQVMQYYFQNRQKDALWKHILWSVENEPGSTATSLGAGMMAAPALGFTAEETGKVRELLLGQATAHPDDVQIVQNAALLLQSTDVLKAEEILKRAQKANPDAPSLNQRLAQLYVACILQTTASLPEARRPIKDAKGAAALAERAKAELVSSDNKVLVQEAARMLRPLPVSQPVFAPVKDIRDRIEAHAQQLGVTTEVAEKPVRVAPELQAAKLVKRVEPVYPEAAKASGMVRVEALVGKDGKVLTVKAVGGPADLTEAAELAVKQWVYKPTLVNGKPVEVITSVDLNFAAPAK